MSVSSRSLSLGSDSYRSLQPNTGNPRRGSQGSVIKGVAVVTVVIVIVAVAVSIYIPGTSSNNQPSAQNDYRHDAGSYKPSDKNGMEWTFLRRAYVRSPSDRNSPNINRMAALDDKVMVTDHNNNKIKLIDTELKEVTAELKVESIPYGVAIVDHQTAVVTYRGELFIQFVIVTDTLALGKKIKVRAQSHGIYSWENMMVVAYPGLQSGEKGGVEILDMSGHVLKRISPERDGKPLLNKPFEVTVSSDGLLYVRDYDQNSVFSITQDGDVKAIYTHHNFADSTGLGAGPDGTVFVCGWNSSSIYQIGPGRDDIQRVLGIENGVEFPNEVFYDNTEDKLYILMREKQVKVYQMKEIK